MLGELFCDTALGFFVKSMKSEALDEVGAGV